MPFSKLISFGGAEAVAWPAGLQNIRKDLWNFAVVDQYEITKEKLDAYVELGLMERIQRSPAMYQWSDAGEAVVEHWRNELTAKQQPQPPSIPEPSEADVVAACNAMCAVTGTVPLLDDVATRRMRAALTTYTARLRERIGGGS